MAISVFSLKRAGGKNTRINSGVLTSTENYATGGISCTPAQIGLSVVDMLQATAMPIAGTSAFVAVYDASASKIKLFWVDTTVDGAALAEVPNATAIGTVVYSFIALGV